MLIERVGIVVLVDTDCTCDRVRSGTRRAHVLLNVPLQGVAAPEVVRVISRVLTQHGKATNHGGCANVIINKATPCRDAFRPKLMT